MTIYLNNEPVSCEQGATITQLLVNQAIEPKGIALAVNNKVILRGAWPTTGLQEADKVVIIRATCGG